MDTSTLEKLEAMFEKHSAALKKKVEEESKNNIAKATEAWEKAEKIEADIASHLDAMRKTQQEHAAQILHLEQSGVKSVATGRDEWEGRTLGQIVTDSNQWKAAKDLGRMDPVNVGSFHRQIGATAIVNATGQNQPLVPSERVPGIIIPTGNRMLTIRDLLPQTRTESNLIEFTKEDTFTNAAAPQGDGSSPQVYENVAKAESAITFTLENEAVQTLAHWIPASRQVLSDASMLQGYINARLTYGLKLEEEEQLLLGDGTGANLNGLVTQASAYDTGLTVADDNMIDRLHHAIYQVYQDSEFVCDGLVVNAGDWHTIEGIKVLAGTDDRYIFANPQGRVAPMLWGVPVVATLTMTSGEWLAGAFGLGAQIWDRWDASIRISEHHDDYFTKNMVAILCEERLALTVYRPAAFITGGYT